MDNLILWLYAIDVAGALDKFFAIVTVVMGAAFIILIIALVGMADTHSSADDWRVWRRFAYIIVSIFPTALLLSLLIPSEKTLYLMMGAKTTQAIVSNPKIQETGGKVMELINKKLEWLAEDEKPAEKKK